MVQIKKFDGKEYRGPYRAFPNRREAEKVAEEMRESGKMLVRIQKLKDTARTLNYSLDYYVLWLRSKARGK